MIESLPDRKCINGKFSAYCKVCWQGVYALWIDDHDHGGVCIEGATRIEDCRQASAWERTKGEILKSLRRQSP